MLGCEPVPRVMSHVGAALTNFVEGMKSNMEIYLTPLLENSCKLLTNTISIVKENIVSVIAATAEAAGPLFNNYFN